MRKLFMILALVLISITLSCEKDNQQKLEYFDCTQTTVAYTYDAQSNLVSTETSSRLIKEDYVVVTKLEEETLIPQFEDANTLNETFDDVNGTYIIYERTTECVKQ